MSSGGKDTLSLEERSRNVQDLLQVLMDINDINGGNSDTAEKMKVHAKNFEAALYAKSSSKKEYMDSMREKVNAMRNTRDNRKKAAASAVSMGAVNRAMLTQQQQQQQQQRLQQAGMAVNGGFIPNTMNMNSHMFLNQQAQVRQQAQQQLKNQQQQQAQQQQQIHGQSQRPQLSAQHQQLINQMKVAIIPRELLQRIPNIPPGVNTWQQITELAQQKRLTAQDMQIAKEIYRLHQQLLYKSRLQQANVNNRINLQQEQLHQQRMAGMSGLQQQQSQGPSSQQLSQQHQGGFQQQQQQQPQQSQGPTSQQLSQQHQGGFQQQQQQQQQQSTTLQQQQQAQQHAQQQRLQQQQQQQGRSVKSEGEFPNMLGQINQIFTPEEQRALLHEAMEACKNFQKTQFGNNMTDSNRQNFIRKYINQKAIKKIQNVRLAQMAASGAAPQQSAAANAQHHAVSLQSQPSAGVGTAGPAGGAPTGGRPSNSTIPGAPTGSSGNGGAHNNSTSNIHNVIPSQGTLSVPYGQSNLRNSTDAAAATQGEAPMQQPNRVAQQQPRPSVLQAFAPTPQDVEVVKRISADAARTPLRLSDLTNTLSPQERDEIKRMLQMNQQLFAQVSNYAPQVYVFTKSENFLKEVLQLRIFVKEILEKCAKEIYVVKLDTVEKLVIKYKKYWESMKIQLLRRQQLIQQQQQLQQQKQKLAVQQQAAGNTQAGLNISQQQQRVQGSLQQIQQQMQQKQRQQQQLQQQHQQHQVQQQRQQSQQQAQKVASTNNNIALAAQNAVTSVSNPSANAASAANVSGAPGYPPPLSDPNVGVSSGSAVGMDAPKTGLGLDFMGSPNLTKGSPPAGATTGISPKRDLAKAAATSNFTKAKSNSLKPSPNASQSNANIPMVVPLPTGSASATPGVLNTGDGVSPLNGKPLTVTNHKTPSPLTVPSISQVQATASNSDNHPFEEEENALRKMNIRKAEIISRFKHRQEVFSKSPLDMFLSTLADCIGVKDSNVEAVMTIPPAVVEQVNGLGKRKLSKMAQRARDQDVVLVSIKDNNKLVMESKTNPDSQTYQIPTSALESVFKDVYGTSDIMTMNFNDPSGTSRSVSDGAVVGSNQMNARKRKLEDLEISPANSANSPSSSLMSDSKKLKVDSPEDVFLTRYGGDVDAKQSTSAELPPINVWDWNYWAKLEQP